MPDPRLTLWADHDPDTLIQCMQEHEGATLSPLPLGLQRTVCALETDPNWWQRMYATMCRTRLLDAAAVHLQRTGKLGTYPENWGLEASSVAIGWAMQKADVFCPYYRDNGAYLARGVPLQAILAYWGGDERGSAWLEPGPVFDLPMCVPIASQCQHALGVAWALAYRQVPQVAVCTVGDGGTSKGDFYAALNAASVWKLPLVVVIHNNQWAISVPLHEQTATLHLAHKAVAARMHAVRVDGWDALASYAVMQAALEHARLGRGPVLVESCTYRVPPHTTADDSLRYRTRQAVEAARTADPLKRVSDYLIGRGLCSKAACEALYTQAESEVSRAAEEYLRTPPQSPVTMWSHLYATLPDYYAEQYAQTGRQ